MLTFFLRLQHFHLLVGFLLGADLAAHEREEEGEAGDEDTEDGQHGGEHEGG